MTRNNIQGKPLSKLTNKEWRGMLIAWTFIGVVMFFLGISDGNWGNIKFGLIFIAIGIVAGFILHYFFGIKIIQLRNDMKHQKYKKR